MTWIGAEVPNSKLADTVNGCIFGCASHRRRIRDGKRRLGGLQLLFYLMRYLLSSYSVILKGRRGGDLLHFLPYGSCVI
jgi:hypothetical protein